MPTPASGPTPLHALFGWGRDFTAGSRGLKNRAADGHVEVLTIKLPTLPRASITWGRRVAFETFEREGGGPRPNSYGSIEVESESEGTGRRWAAHARIDLIAQIWWLPSLAIGSGDAKEGWYELWAEGMGSDPARFASPTFVLIHENMTAACRFIILTRTALTRPR